MEEILVSLQWRPGKIDRQPGKPVGVLSRAAENSKCERLLGWSPSISLEVGVGKTVKWYVASLAPGRLRKLERLLLERQ